MARALYCEFNSTLYPDYQSSNAIQYTLVVNPISYKMLLKLLLIASYYISWCLYVCLLRFQVALAPPLCDSSDTGPSASQ